MSSKSMKRVKLYWYNATPNLGDALSPYIVSRLFSLKTDWVDPEEKCKKYFATGSIINKADDLTEVWGSGLLSLSFKPAGKPTVHAVRGPLTRSRMNSLGIKCPNAMGDPSLLMPQVYNPTVDKKFKVGIIPHYVDKNHRAIESVRSETLVIDVQNENVEQTVDQILSCELIISSSLHGLIIADAYGIPNVWIRLSNKIVGGDFKFNDYFLSVQRFSRKPLPVGEKLNFKAIAAKYKDEKPVFDSEPLLESNPFS